MDDTRRDAEDEPGTSRLMNRRVFFGRSLALAGATVGLLGLTGCPGGDGDDDDDDDGDDD